MRERGGLVVESRILEHEVRGSILTQGTRLWHLLTKSTQEVVLHPDMTEKLFTGMLSKNETKW